MKKYFALLLLLLPMLLTGCYDKWDYAGCPVDDNFELRFTLTGEGGGDLFAGKIDKVDVVLFDQDGDFVLHKSVLREDLGPQNSIRLTVDPGTYYVVALGNIGSYSTISTLAKGASIADSYVEVTSNETGGPHYYAPAQNELTRALDGNTDHSEYKVVLPPGEVVEKELNFVRAHRTVNVYVKGLGNLPAYGGTQARVELTNIPCKYDFYRRTAAVRKNYVRTTQDTETNAGSMVKTSFSAPICSFADDMNIYLRSTADGTQLIDPICLKTWVEQNTPEYLNEFDVLITITKQGDTVKVDVTLPDWEAIGVDPGDL